MATLIVAFLADDAHAQDLDWAKLGGGIDVDWGRGAAALADGSVVIMGEFRKDLTLGTGEPKETTLIAPRSFSVFVARYNADGTLAWARGAGGNARAGSIASFSDESTVVTGGIIGTVIFGAGEPNETTLASVGGSDVYLARYNGDGTLAWVVQTTGSAVSGGGVAAVADGSCLITAGFGGTMTFGLGEPNETTLSSPVGSDTFLARYNADGTFAWVVRADADGSRAVAAFADGSAVITGGFRGSATFGAGEANETTLVSVGDEDIFVARYNAGGTLAWAKQAGGIFTFEFGRSVAAFADGSSVVTGRFTKEATFGADEPKETLLSSGCCRRLFLARFNADGTLAWAKKGEGDSQGNSVAAFADGSSVVAGLFQNAVTLGLGESEETELLTGGPAGGGLVARYNADGTLAWARRAGVGSAVGFLVDGGYGVAAFADGSAVAVGSFSGTETFGVGEANETILTSVLSDLWVARYRGAGPTLELQVPAPIVQECDAGDASATVFFVVEVLGDPPSGAVLRVTDTTGARTLLSQTATTGATGVGPVVFPIGVADILVEIVDAVVRSETFTIMVQDTVPPTLSGCIAKTIECQSPQTTLFRSLLGISASDDCDPNPQIVFTPTAVGLGTTAVVVTARDATGNVTQCTIDVTVVDTTPPMFTVCPADITRECTGPTGAGVSFDVLAEDECGSVTVVCKDQNDAVVDPAGTVFAVGTHTVTCTATDGSDNSATCTFTVTIVDSIAPVIVCPDDITVGNDAGECFAFVAFTVTATDECDPTVAIVCTAPGGPVQSGDTFLVGMTTVTCTATDLSGNQATCSFNIVVQDTEAPALTCPASVTLVTDCAGNPFTASTADLGVSATDNCDLDVAIVCTPNVLSPGTTTVVCTATDDDGNESTCSVNVTILKGPFDCQFLRPLDGNVDNRINPGRTVPVKVKVTCENVFDDGVTATIDEVVQIDGVGTPVSNEVVDDAGQSSDNGNVMRLADGFHIFNLSTASWPDDSGARFKVVVRIAKPGHVDTLCEVILKNK